MRLKRMGSFHQCRLSFMRSLLRHIKQESWRFDRPLWDIDDRGVGRAVYRARTPDRSYSLVAFAHDLPDDQRSDRVIATAWDATFTLFDGEPTDADLTRLESNVPKQEAGRISDSELSLSRANRSVRLWSHVIDRLAAGEQPDADLIESVGYLMRTTAVYGSGKFGAADRGLIVERTPMNQPFRAELLTVFLIRAFAMDLVEHMARQRGGDQATVIDPELRRRFGVGNSTGLGMAPFLVNHPLLLHNWMTAREEALARVRSLATASDDEVSCFRHYLRRAQLNARQWRSEHPLQVEKIAALRADLQTLGDFVEDAELLRDQPWDRLYRWAEQTLTFEGQEQLVALMMEPYGALIDDLTKVMDADEYAAFRIDGAMTLSALEQALTTHYNWALALEDAPGPSRARFWYVSQEKLEPRLGERYEEPEADYEQPYGFGIDMKSLSHDLESRDADESVADFLLAHPEHRHLVRRLQTVAKYPYAELRDNLISAQMLPIDILRCKLSFFGATRFDPRSDRWVRICMYQGAPFPNELQTLSSDDWCYPGLEQTVF